MSKSLDGVLTKKANTRESYTEEQILDLHKCMDPVKGYLFFAEQFVLSKIVSLLLQYTSSTFNNNVFFTK